jgi:uncharacterized small protein (DUF1192 family)
MRTLNMDYEISEKLLALYDYLHRRLVEANIHKDVEIINEVRGFLVELRDAWQEAVQKASGTPARAAAAGGGGINLTGLSIGNGRYSTLNEVLKKRENLFREMLAISGRQVEFCRGAELESADLSGLMELVDRRQLLMDEIDRLNASLTPEQTAAAGDGRNCTISPGSG